MKPKLRLPASIAAFALSTASSFGMVSISSRSELDGNDLINWSQLSSAGLPILNPLDIVSDKGLGIVAKTSSGMFFRGDQDDSWNGNFAAGDALLQTPSASIVLEFASAVKAVGAQIQNNVFGAFLCQISAFDIDSNLLGVYFAGGQSNSNNDNSALFIGLADTSASISRVEFSVVGSEDFAINQVSLAVPRPVPDSGHNLLLLAIGLAGLVAWRRRRSA